MQIARVGDVEAMRALFGRGQVGPSFKDEEGITPLHVSLALVLLLLTADDVEWAAINNRYPLCQYLLEMGADVNVKGGDAVATPAMWAAQRCNYYVVNLLLRHGADPISTDGQGYNILHLATFDGNVFLLTLLLHQNIPIDCQDLQGHTCLMWAAYKGFPACVDLFLRWGASVGATDDNGFTALHWSLVRGSPACISKLVEYGSDRFAKTTDGKTPLTVATEMRSLPVWYRALGDRGFDTSGHPMKFPLPFGASIMQPATLGRMFFLLPFPMIFLVALVMSKFMIVISVPLALCTSFGFIFLTQRLAVFAPPNMRHVQQTVSFEPVEETRAYRFQPFVAGIFAASCFWIAVRWFTKILPSTYRSVALWLLLTRRRNLLSSSIHEYRLSAFVGNMRLLLHFEHGRGPRLYTQGKRPE